MPYHPSTFSPPPPSVHPHESNRQSTLPPPPHVPKLDALADISFRHSGWIKTRRRVSGAMVEAMCHEDRILEFEQCGHGAFVMRSTEDPGCYKVRCIRCRDRFCKPCARERAGIVARNLLAHVADRKIRFVTLTLKDATSDLRLELDRLYDSFRKLQRRAFWKHNCWGGAAMLEVKWNAGSGRWHPHLHVLVEGTYLAQTKLRSEWKACTGDSWIVDVRAVHDNGKVVRYITKYATDPLDSSVMRCPSLLAEAIPALKGRRACMTFGTWRGVTLTKQDSEDAWEIVATLTETIWQSNYGIGEDSQMATHILRQLWAFDEDRSKNENTPIDTRSPPDPTLFNVPF